MSKTRIASVVGITSAVMLAFAPSAQANWEGTLNGVKVGHESKRWKDELYSQITWHRCDASTFGTGAPKNFTAQIWEDIDFQPDESYDQKTFTGCFVGSTVSNGEWTDLPSGMADYYFQIMKIASSGGSVYQLDVGRYVVDTTKADG